MLDQLPEVGTVVLSKAGRDAGRYFVVVGKADENHVLLCDGDLHKLAHPKKKKLKHLETKPVVIPTIRDQLNKGNGLYDAEIRRNMEALGYTLKDKALERQYGGITCQNQT
jgi:ribosomal protein L14E/L6E/L27E